MNPHTRYEICLDKTPRWFSLAAILLMATCILGVIYLSTEAPEVVIPPSAFAIPKLPQVPDVKVKIQRGDERALVGKPAVQR